jgi:two-component system response regulator DegU
MISTSSSTLAVDDDGAVVERIAIADEDLRVLSLVIEGNSNREISKKLGIREELVRNHINEIGRKLGVSSRLELVLFAIHHKLVARNGKR